MEMDDEEACWICRRRKKELLEQVKKDGMEDYIDEKNVLTRIADMYDCDYTKYICATCMYVVGNVAEMRLASLVDDERLKISFEE
jgi:hypothetical protein